MGRETIVLLLAFACPTVVTADERELQSLRQELAMRFLEPETHVSLAKYHHRAGNRLLAFSILEYARRSKFQRKEFDEAFDRVFRGNEPFDNSQEAEAALLKRYATDKNSRDVLFSLSDIYISRADWARAENCLKTLIALKPDEYEHVAALAEVVRRAGNPAEAKRIVNEYRDDYPESKYVYRQRIQPLMRENLPGARQLLTEAIEKHPNDGGFTFNLAVVLQRDGETEQAHTAMLKAAQLAPDSSFVQGQVGRFMLKTVKDEKKALKCYLNAYFLDPHFYDTEYAESRIRALSATFSQAELEKRVAKGASLETLLDDANPVFVRLAIERIADTWNTKYTPSLVDSMGHDDPSVRWLATAALIKHTDETFDPELDKLLTDGDLRKRGLAAYILIHRRKEESVSTLQQFLKEDAQLLRYDAISALLQEGGEESLRIVKEHLAKERHPWFQAMARRMMRGT